MTAERWQQIKTIFHAAAELSAAERVAFLNAVCAQDVELRREVESLLATDERAGSFIKRPLLTNPTPVVPHAAELDAGQIISQYRIERRLGAGGMGVVYLAQDMELGRSVALKLLQTSLTQDAARVRRFRQEARAASALNHPNILTIYKVGEAELSAGSLHFIAAEFVEGQTLRALYQNSGSEGGIPLGEALELLIQVAGALAAAHEAGIIHRDIKPENIMRRPDGIVKVLDFGLAKLTEQATRPASLDFAHVTTQPGIVMGTVSYMSPEQARGFDVDTRSDLFSLGVVMYELLAGRAPFEGETTGDVLAALLSGEPRPLSRYAARLPAPLQEIVDRALAKRLEQRYQTAHEISDDLKRLKEDLEFTAKLNGTLGTEEDILTMMVGKASDSAEQTTFATRQSDLPAPAFNGRSADPALHTNLWNRRGWLAFAGLIFGGMAVALGWQRFALRTKAIDSVAVLPFLNVGGDPQMEYLPDGLTENLIISLSRLPALKKVVARDTVFTYKGRSVDPREVGNALDVRSVVTGRVQKQGDQLTIRAELVGASDGARLWGEEYKCQFTNLLTVQEEMARDIGTALRLRLSGEERQQLANRHTANPTAHELYLKGRHLYSQFTRESQEKALNYFKQAIALDPRYALAYAGIADVYSDFSSQYLPPGEAMSNARWAAQMAISLDETLAEAHHSMALVKLWGDWDWAGAEREFKRAIQLDPNLVTAHIYYAERLANQSRFEEALREIHKAMELDPRSAQAIQAAGRTYLCAGQYGQAIEHAHKALDLEPSFATAHSLIGRVFIEKKMYPEALAAFRQALTINSSNANRSWLATAYALNGQREEAKKILKELEDLATRTRVSPIYLSRIHFALGEKDRTFIWLRRAYEEHSDHLISLGVEPLYHSLHDDPRFTELLRGLGLMP